MRRLEICSSKVLAWVAVSLAAGGGSTVASAQSFDFTFSGSGLTASGVFNVTAIAGSPGEYTINSISGAVSGFPSGSDNGSITSLLAPNAYGGNDNILLDRNTGYLDANGVSFSVAGGAEENLFYIPHEYTLYNDNTGDSKQGTLSVSPTTTPAPIPGAGLLSSLVLGFAGLLSAAKSAWGRAGNALARLSLAASARLFAPKPSLAQLTEAAPQSSR
jgi:hypothetical protein